MFTEQNLYLFFVASLLLNLTPGNDVIYVISRSISQGAKAGIISAFGIFIGCFVHILAAILGLSIIIAESAMLFDIIKFIGAAYLIYLGIKAFTAATDTKNNIEKLPVASKRKLFKQGIITNALNPKVAIFFLSFLPQFVDAGSSFYKLQLFTLGLWFAVQGTLILILIAVITGRTGNFLKRNASFWKWQQKITGIILISLGIKIAFTSKN
jgi:threonine/homoserine/homoserine lactone efflux protein